MSTKSRAALLLLLFFLPAALPLAAAPKEPPKLAVIVSVDGLSWERLDGWRAWWRAGLARLLSEGRVETAARYAHLNTETGPGHASLGTGAPPRVTGIVTNKWYEKGVDGRLKSYYCTDQPAPDAHGDPNARPVPGPANLRVPTLGDRLAEARPGSRVVALSGKDRGAIFLAGHRPQHAVYWFDPDAGVFTSSPAYDASAGAGKLVADVVKRFTESPSGKLPLRFGRAWSELPIPDGLDVSTFPRPAHDITFRQMPTLGLGFDHPYGADPDGYFTGIKESPAIDELLADLAIQVLKDPALALGRGKTTDLLCLSFSGQDLVSHSYGNESEENLDLLRRLDVQLGRVLDALDAEVGKGRVLLALSADHGFSPIPEVRKKRGEPAGRLVASKDSVFPFVARLNRRLDEILCLDPAAAPVAGSDGFDLYYEPRPLVRAEGACGPTAEIGRAEIDGVLPRAVHELFAEEVSEVLLSSKRASWSPDGAAAFAANDFDAARSGDALLVPKPGVIVHWDGARGSSHGSHFEESIHVPLVFWGARVKPGPVGAPSTPYDLAPTLAAAVGVPLPDATGRALPLE